MPTSGHALVSFSPAVNPWTGVPIVVSVRSRCPVARRIPTWPPHALPTQSTGSVEPKSVHRLFGGGHHLFEGEIPWHGIAFAV